MGNKLSLWEEKNEEIHVLSFAVSCSRAADCGVLHARMVCAYQFARERDCGL
jgi:hypothetical protein